MRVMSHLKTGVVLLCCCLAACGDTPTGSNLDGIFPGDAPMVVSTVPTTAASTVLVTSSVSATFSQPMEATTIDRATFTLRLAEVLVSGAVTYDNETDTATFTPEAGLDAGRLYTATVTTGARGRGGREMLADHVWSFTTAGIEVNATGAVGEFVPAPDYVLTMEGVIVLADVDNIVSSVTGEAVLTTGLVTGQRYVVVGAGGLDTNAEIDGAYLAGADAALTTSVAAEDFALVGADLTESQVRTLIIANISSGVRSYQTFEITFLPPD